MNNVLKIMTVMVFFSGCSSFQPVSVTDPADRHQAAKTQYYNNLNSVQVRSAEEQRHGESDVATIVARVDPQ